MTVAPDASYERFWYIFKDSVKNFNDSSDKVKLDQLVSQIPDLTKHFNELQARQEYAVIYVQMESFLLAFLWAILREFRNDRTGEYHLSIAEKNLRRWLTVRREVGRTDLAIDKELHLLRMLMSWAPENRIPPYLLLFSPVELQRHQGDLVKTYIARITRWALDHQVEAVLNRLLVSILHSDTIEEIRRTHPHVDPTTKSARKILKI
jgi:hypothetical protein